MPRKKKTESAKEDNVVVMEEKEYQDYEVFNEEVAKAVKEGRVVKVGDRWRVYKAK